MGDKSPRDKEKRKKKQIIKKEKQKGGATPVSTIKK
jgi:hypothetical protein